MSYCRPCDVYYDPHRRDNFCPHGWREPRRCAFCDNASNVECTRQVRRAIPVKVANLTADEVFSRVLGGARRLVSIISITDFNPFCPTRVLQVRFFAEGRLPAVDAAWKWPNDALVDVLVATPCKTPCCDLHHRELGEHSFACREHWDHWMEGGVTANLTAVVERRPDAR